MRQYIFVFVFCMCLAASGRAQTVAFGAGDILEGRPVTRDWSQEVISDRELKVGGVRFGSSHNEETSNIRTIETITAMKNGSIAGLKVFYEKYVDNEKELFEGVPYDRTVKDFLQGRTFLVQVGASGVKATLENGGAPPRREKEYVEDAFADLGKSEPAVKYFCNKTVPEGQPLRVPAEVLRKLFHAPDARVESGPLILKGIQLRQGAQAAVFGVEARLAFITSGLNMKMSLNGEIWIGVKNGLPVYVQLNGPVDVTGYEQIENRLVMVTGKGTVKMSESIGYAR